MSEVKQLREQQARIATEARAKYDQIDDKTDEVRAQEIETEFDGLMGEYDKLSEKIERMERLESAERSLERPDPRRPGSDGVAAGEDRSSGGPSYREAFHSYLRAAGNVAALHPEEAAVLRGGYANVEQRAQTSGTDSAGGYSVPETMLENIVVSMKAWGPMWDDSPFTVINTSGGNPMPFPTVDDTETTAGAHTEGATLTDDGGKDVTFGQKLLSAYSFDTEWLRVSRELADDSFEAMETFLSRLLGERLARIANAKLTNGSGSSDVEGIVTNSGAGKVATATDAITYDEILDLEHAVNRAYRRSPNAGYMLSDKTLLAVRKLKDGDGNYLWQMGNVQQGVPSTINGRPFWVNDDMQGLGDGADSKVMLFGDMSAFYVRKVGQPLIGAIQDKDFWPGFGIAGYIRFDGSLSDTSAVKHLALASA